MARNIVLLTVAERGIWQGSNGRAEYLKRLDYGDGMQLMKLCSDPGKGEGNHNTQEEKGRQPLREW